MSKIKKVGLGVLLFVLIVLAIETSVSAAKCYGYYMDNKTGDIVACS